MEFDDKKHIADERDLVDPLFWAFVDNENFPGFFRNRDIEIFDRLYIFIGSNQKGLSVELVLRLQPMSHRVRFILVEESGRNNLDMYLIFYLGLAHSEAEENVRFVIFSSDSDFDNIINHCNNRLNRPCIRIMDEANINPQHRLTKDSHDAAGIEVLPYQKLLENLYKIHTVNPNSLPQKKSTMMNFIGSIIRPFANGKTADEFFQQLINDHKIKLSEHNKIVYLLKPSSQFILEPIDVDTDPEEYAI